MIPLVQTLMETSRQRLSPSYPKELKEYLRKVSGDVCLINYEVMYRMNNLFNLLSTLKVCFLVLGLLTKTNDMMLVLYESA